MELIGLIILGFIGFIVIGLLGHLLDIIGAICGWLFDGCMSSIGCLFWVVIIILVLMSITI